MNLETLKNFTKKLLEKTEEQGIYDSFWNLNPVCMTHDRYFNNPETGDVPLIKAEEQLYQNLQNGDAWSCKIMALYLLGEAVGGYKKDFGSEDLGFNPKEEAKYFLELGVKDINDKTSSDTCAAMLAAYKNKEK